MSESPARRVRDALLKKVIGDSEMFALGSSIGRVIQMADADDQGLHELAYYVLSDVALTQRILRLSNTVVFRTKSGSPVTTISRAISLLGFDNVKTTALAMLLVDALDNSTHSRSVRIELEQALCASLVGREMARSGPYQGAEEAAIGALFKNLGPLLVATHEYPRYSEIMGMIDNGQHTAGQASQDVLGCSYDALSEAVLKEWKIPDTIIRSLPTLPSGQLKPAASRPEWVRQVANFSAEVAALLSESKKPAHTAKARALRTRYGAALNLNAEQLADLFTSVQKEMGTLLQSMNMQPDLDDDDEDNGVSLPDVLMLATLGGDQEAASGGCYPSGKPFNARELLLAGVQDVTQMRAKGKVNALILAILETLCQSMGFRFATLCLKDERNGEYRARVSFGENHADRQNGFRFPIESSRDLFRLAMETDADLMIADAGTPKIRELLPKWHRALLPDARSFIVLPLVIDKIQLGLFYADRAQAALEGVPPDEASLIKVLKGQALAAFTPEQN
jgi:HD-like signal output (HDOD) protein